MNRGGKRSGQALVARRTDVVRALLVDGRSRAEIIVECEREHDMSPRTTDDHIRRVRTEWATDRAATKDIDRELTIARLTRLARVLEKRGAWSALMSCERLLADVRGVRVIRFERSTGTFAPDLPMITVTAKDES